MVGAGGGEGVLPPSGGRASVWEDGKVLGGNGGGLHNDVSVLGWPKSPYGFFRKIKDTFFIFTDNCIDLAILSMPALSHVVEC